MIAPETAWAERERCDGCLPDGTCDGAGSVLPLGPIEPLRKVAERARNNKACNECGKPATVTHPSIGTFCEACAPVSDNWSGLLPLKFIIVCSPESAMCAACDGAGWGRKTRLTVGGAILLSSSENCAVCAGTGKALGSAEIASELLGRHIVPCAGRGPVNAGLGGLSVLLYNSRAELDEHAIGDALRIAMEAT